MFLRVKCALIFFVVLVFPILSQSEIDRGVLDYLKEAQPQGWGAPIIIDRRVGVLSGEQESVVVLYSYSIGTEQDRNGWQFLIAKTGESLTESVQVGGGFQYFRSLLIKNETIYLYGSRRVEGDSMVELSQPIELAYVLVNGKLMALGRDTET